MFIDFQKRIIPILSYEEELIQNIYFDIFWKDRKKYNMTIVPLCEECNIQVTAPSFSCSLCGEMPCSNDLKSIVEHFLDNISDIPRFPTIYKYSSYLLAYQNTRVLPIIIHRVYKTALEDPKIVYSSDILRNVFLARIPHIRASEMCNEFSPLMDILPQIEETFSPVAVNNYKINHPNNN